MPWIFSLWCFYLPNRLEIEVIITEWWDSIQWLMLSKFYYISYNQRLWIWVRPTLLSNSWFRCRIMRNDSVRIKCLRTSDIPTSLCQAYSLRRSSKNLFYFISDFLSVCLCEKGCVSVCARACMILSKRVILRQHGLSLHSGNQPDSCLR